jgi:hypothetical protein
VASFFTAIEMLPRQLLYGDARLQRSIGGVLQGRDVPEAASYRKLFVLVPAISAQSFDLVDTEAIMWASKLPVTPAAAATCGVLKFHKRSGFGTAAAVEERPIAGHGHLHRPAAVIRYADDAAVFRHDVPPI